ncbi:MAG: hypothetical protein Q7U72_08415 [Brevundimonas sp.]|uniref:hypothetical protein n=1 Tax=Brevundimonas sp. TaxID=1871086 RepID=UPI0027187617|nr:hypothetical protein [Brevundimonas sp.]MDO9077457.1 hypothetical protein [Brevundimonas sp.]MDZ4059760.1 hypothetical protein [Brevundimonas sp.]
MELEQRAAERHAPEVCADFSDMALQWRRLAGRAMVQDQRAATIMGTSQPWAVDVEAVADSSDSGNLPVGVHLVGG